MKTYHYNMPSKVSYRQRMRAIGLAIKAVREARSVGVVWADFELALKNLRQARKRTWYDHRRTMELWKENGGSER